jgi:hypothetical protein
VEEAITTWQEYLLRGILTLTEDMDASTCSRASCSVLVSRLEFLSVGVEGEGIYILNITSSTLEFDSFQVFESRLQCKVAQQDMPNAHPLSLLGLQCSLLILCLH